MYERLATALSLGALLGLTGFSCYIIGWKWTLAGWVLFAIVDRLYEPRWFDLHESSKRDAIERGLYRRRMLFWTRLLAIFWAWILLLWGLRKLLPEPVPGELSIPWLVAFGSIWAASYVGLLLHLRRIRPQAMAMQKKRNDEALRIVEARRAGTSSEPFGLVLRSSSETRTLPADWLSPDAGKVTLEGVIHDELSCIGPTVMLSDNKPFAYLTPGRVRTPEYEDWRDHARDLAGHADLIVLVPSGREGLVWEISMLLSDQSLLAKALVVVPPLASKASRNPFRFRARRLEEEVKERWNDLELPIDMPKYSSRLDALAERMRAIWTDSGSGHEYQRYGAVFALDAEGRRRDIIREPRSHGEFHLVLRGAIQALCEERRIPYRVLRD